MEQMFDRGRQETAIINAFEDAFQDDVKMAERIMKANPDLCDRMIRAINA